ncbi:MAG: response regulator [Bacteroidales bacterium]|jgi:CheY-like chemotaxis protein|nr:response regulator [Bacteroidales bacterium]MCI1734039.1 response regulator [Bacteroidales bacterium]
MANTPGNRRSELVDSEKDFFSLLYAACRKMENKINIITEFSNLLVTSSDSEERETYAHELVMKSAETRLLLSDLKDIINISTGKDVNIPAPVDVDALLNELIFVNRSQIKSDKVTLNYKGGYGRPFVINTISKRITKIINNLISNSIHYTEQGSINVGFKVKGCDKLYFYVEDTGKGISAENLKSIFDDFFRLDRTVAGTGLGLTICRILVKEFGGELGAESELNKGSKFWFTIPYESSDKESTIIMETEAEDVEVKKPFNGGMPKVLVAEDDSANYFLFESILKNNYLLVHAANGLEAVEMHKKEKPDIIIMDVKMPVMDGFQAITEIRKIDKDIPIIAATAYALPEVEEKLYACGANDYIVKPLSPSDLRSKLQKIVENGKKNI